MKSFFFLVILSVCIVNSFAQSSNFHALVIHGGAGDMTEISLPPLVQKDYLKVLNHALQTGDSVLKQGGTCMDAVEKTIQILEDCPLFNAGKGAVLNHEGIAELDASVMDGKTLAAGAVAGIQDIKNPISLARKVMEKSEHVFLTGTGASKFAI
jgi:L-asparaginase / beta-aspartyl-peptidase